jgi:hypothetical protein
MLVPRQEYSRELKIARMRELDSHTYVSGLHPLRLLNETASQPNQAGN